MSISERNILREGQEEKKMQIRSCPELCPFEAFTEMTDSGEKHI